MANSSMDNRRPPINPHHGGSGTPLYNVWRSMRQRVLAPASKDYARYGGRGITLDPSWNSFTTFQKWSVDNGYVQGLELDRIDNDGPYSPTNCRWADRKMQCRNRSGIRILTYRGKTAPLAQHAEDAGLPPSIVYGRVVICGWSVSRALTTPILSRSERAKAWRKRKREAA